MISFKCFCNSSVPATGYSLNSITHSFPLCSRVVCKCGSCGTKKLALSEWEKHTGCKIKNWKASIKVKDSLIPLEQWVRILNAYDVLCIM